MQSGFPLIQVGGVEPFDTFDAIIVGVSRNDLSYAEAAHNGSVNKVLGIYIRMQISQLCCQDGIICMNRLDAATHRFHKFAKNSTPFRPPSRGQIVVDDLLKYR